ncbi:MAG: alpha-mannosidase, partial [Cyanobacteria bacterium CRU_2_1]|nr:alpha-mannosidase [Cyanobacteria bacterium CRU_2_1]
PPSPLPTWNDELYLEFHRGCYTTHADQKQQNRQCERLLYEAELFTSIAALLTQTPYPKASLERAWKQILFNQFHDILPGSAIPEVYEDANRAWQEARQVGDRIRDAALRTIACQIIFPAPPYPDAKPIVVFNALNWERSAVVTLQIPCDGEPSSPNWQIYSLEGDTIETHCRTEANRHDSLSFWAEQIPAIGYHGFWLCPSSPNLRKTQSQSPSALEDLGGEKDLCIADLHPDSSPKFTLENEFLAVTINPATGDLSNIFDKIQQREILRDAGNQLQAFQDHGQYWDAWNIDPNYAQFPLAPAQLKAISADRLGTLETQIHVTRSIGQSTFKQSYRLQKGSPVLQIVTIADWQEQHILVKAAFPLHLEADYASYEMPYGAIERPTQSQHDRDKAKWEVPALQWADLSDGHYGVSILSDYKHGYDSQPNQLRLTLLRGSEWPDPMADYRSHLFTYAIYPHRGNWQTAQTVRRAYELNHPLQVVMLKTQEPDAPHLTLPPIGQFLNLHAENWILTAFKQAEDHPEQWVLRGYECHGQTAKLSWQNSLGLLTDSLDSTTWRSTNLLEQPNVDDRANNPEETAIEPWRIATFLLNQRHS